MPNPSPEPRCKFCSTPLLRKRAWQQFCSNKCRNDFHLRRRHAEREEFLSQQVKDVSHETD